METVEVIVTAKIKILPTQDQKELLDKTLSAVKTGLNLVSNTIFKDRDLVQLSLHKKTYHILREEPFNLRSQMACSVVKTAIAKYKSVQSNDHEFTKVFFKKPEYDLVWNRDYSLKNGLFSLNTLSGRIKVPFQTEGMEQYFDGNWSFGTAKLVYKHGKYFLHIPMTKDVEAVKIQDVKNVVGVDLGINFLAVSYDSKGKTTFYNGREIKQKRATYKKVRQELQLRKTPSSRRRLKAIGQRENRWMTDVNHRVSKTLVEQAGKNALIVLEDLTGIRNATEKVRLQKRYVSVSWAFYQLGEMIRYKAELNESKTIKVSPKYTSQKCPCCGHTERGNRDKKNHIFRCKNCGYGSNDDRIGAINLQRDGIEYVHAELVKQGLTS